MKSKRPIGRLPLLANLKMLALCCVASLAAVPPYPKTGDGYDLPDHSRPLAFPQSHASHPSFKSEWWYLTGHLTDPANQKDYGFQLTFFRSATRPENTPPERASQAAQIYMAHAALLDKSTGTHLHEERLNRDGWNADASSERLDVFNGNWFLKMTDPAKERMQARFSLGGEQVIELEFSPLKPKVLFGDQGISRKGEDPTAKSYYITFTRLQTKGTLKTRDGESALEGLTWMDHEISSSQLSPGQIGWNWTSIHFDDGTELMAYVMRRSDGQTDPFSVLNLIDVQGNLRQIPADRFTWTPDAHWTSPHSQARYPIDYTIRWTDANGPRSVIIRSPFPEQEMRGEIARFNYWEGAGEAYDANGRRIGLTYTELTGYDESLFGKF